MSLLMDTCSQEKELGAQKLAKLQFYRITGRKIQDLLSLEMLNIDMIMCDMKTEISAIDKHFHVCAVLQIYNLVNCCV